MKVVHRRYACHRVYDSYHHYVSQSVVAISDKGEVMECTPLTQETSFTEWIGGVIVLSPLSEMDSVTDFKTMTNGMVHQDQTPLYAWHVSNFDFSKEELTPQSIVKRL
jgi:hypothetical protein